MMNSNLITALKINAQREVLLKWHRLRGETGVTAFDRAYLKKGLQIGASMEVDLNFHADGGFIVLHDDFLDKETSHKGLVRETSLSVLKLVKLRNNLGQISDVSLMTDSDIVEEMSRNPHRDALLQLDVKQSFAELQEVGARRLIDLFEPVNQNICISTNCIELLAFISENSAKLRLGYDPTSIILKQFKANKLNSKMDVVNLLELLITNQFGKAYKYIYLNYRLILEFVKHDINLVKICQSQGALVDAWTLDFDDEKLEKNFKKIILLGVDQITTNTIFELSALYHKYTV